MSISIVIPTLNEAACIGDTLRSLRRQRPLEIIIADGGSTDGTHALIRDADVLVTASPGRAMQMNAGAARARGEYLLFLHADCMLEDGALAAAESLLLRRSVSAGCFT